MLFTQATKSKLQNRLATRIAQAVDAMPQENQHLPNQIDGMVPVFYKSFSGVLFGDSPLARYGIYHSKGKMAVIRINHDGTYRQVFAGTKSQSLRFVRANISKSMRKNSSLNEVFFMSHLAVVNNFLALAK